MPEKYPELVEEDPEPEVYTSLKERYEEVIEGSEGE